MKIAIVGMVAAASFVFAGSVLAAEPAAGKAKCGMCHALDTKKMGPSYVDIAAKYKGNKDAAGKLAENIAKGGSYGWNMGKMPAKGMGANEAEIKSMAEYIISLEK
jgi:cytochrome c